MSFSAGVSFLFLTGQPGAGKSTWGRGVADAFGWSYVSIGDRLRKSGYAAELVDRPFGPDEVVSEIVAGVVGGPPGAVVDGYPRKASQVFELERLRDLAGVAVRVVWFEVPELTVLARYANAEYLMSPASGKYGPEGDTCPAGGVYSLPLAAHYREKRAGQQSALRGARSALEECGFPMVYRGLEVAR